MMYDCPCGEIALSGAHKIKGTSRFEHRIFCTYCHTTSGWHKKPADVIPAWEAACEVFRKRLAEIRATQAKNRANPNRSQRVFTSLMSLAAVMDTPRNYTIEKETPWDGFSMGPPIKGLRGIDDI